MKISVSDCKKTAEDLDIIIEVVTLLEDIVFKIRLILEEVTKNRTRTKERLLKSTTL